MTRRSDDDPPPNFHFFFFLTDLLDSREWPISRWKRRISPKGDKFAPLDLSPYHREIMQNILFYVDIGTRVKQTYIKGK